ncbi:hypothetical protein, partial [Paracoccus sp. (in: a-proteobacteria)]|uniref:hypothetical protein n=1 Tax=Paracoccus sp. TaxID=267 RepID=UPI0028A97D54
GHLPRSGRVISNPACFLSFQAGGGGLIVRAMTRMQQIIATDPHAHDGARPAVNLRGLLLLTLR